jgi:hypothetical protein
MNMQFGLDNHHINELNGKWKVLWGFGDGKIKNGITKL